jgi:hypothetical protein
MPVGFDVGLLPDDATFEASLGNWYSGVSNWPIDRVTSPAPHAGSGVLRTSYTGGSPNPVAVPILGSGDSSDYYYVAADDDIIVTGWLRSDPANLHAGGYTVIIELQAFDAAGHSVGTWDSTQDALSESAWAETLVEAVMPAGAAWVSIQIQPLGPLRGIVATGDRFYLSDVAANLRHPLVPPPTQAMATVARNRLHRVGGGVQ